MSSIRFNLEFLSIHGDVFVNEIVILIGLSFNKNACNGAFFIRSQHLREKYKLFV